MREHCVTIWVITRRMYKIDFVVCCQNGKIFDSFHPSRFSNDWAPKKSVIDVVKGGVAWECERVSNQELFTLNLNVQFYTSYFFWKRWIKKNQPNISTVLKQHNDYDYWCVNDNSLESFILFTILCFILFQLFSHSFSFALSFFLLQFKML
jgi:hypothetical protein